MSEVIVLYEGYSMMSLENTMAANCTCTLIKGENNVIIDTMTAWDRQKILNGLNKQGIKADLIDYVVSTHGHSDHIGNNNLFLKAKHIVGFSISYKDTYYLHAFDKGEEYSINSSVKVLPTPGHTLSDVSVLVTTKTGEKVAIAGDLFEKYEDIYDQDIWQEAGSENIALQKENRLKIAEIADYIVPGHGSMFNVTDEDRKALREQIVVMQEPTQIETLLISKTNSMYI